MMFFDQRGRYDTAVDLMVVHNTSQIIRIAEYPLEFDGVEFPKRVVRRHEVRVAGATAEFGRRRPGRRRGAQQQVHCLRVQTL